MGKNIRVILLETLHSLGQAGDIVVVSEGYARNFLFPQAKAALATETSQQKQQQQIAKKEEQSQRELKTLQEQAEKLEGTELEIQARIKDGTEIFGSITAGKIAQELSERAGFKFKASDINIAKPIKEIGSQDVTVHLSPEIETTIHLTVVADLESTKDDEE